MADDRGTDEHDEYIDSLIASVSATPSHVFRCSSRIRLWCLRLLVLAGGHSQFLQHDGFGNDDIARELGLTDQAGRRFDRASALRELQKLHKEAERDAATSTLPETLAHNIERISRIVRLSALDCDLLACAVLLRQDRTLNQAAECLGSLSTVRLFHVLARMLACPEGDIRAALGSNSALARSCLLRIDEQGSYSLLLKLDLVSPIFADRIVSSEADPLELLNDRICRAPAAGLVLADYHHIPEVAQLLLPYVNRVLTERRRGCNVVLYGPVGSGKTQLVRALADAIDTPLFEVATVSQFGDAITGRDRLRSWRLGQQLLTEQRAMLIFDEFSDVVGGQPSVEHDDRRVPKAFLTKAMEEAPILTFFVLNDPNDLDPAYTRRADIVLEVRVSSMERRRQMVELTAGDFVGRSTVNALAAVETVTPAILERARRVVDTVGHTMLPPDREQAFRFLVGGTIKAQTGRAIDYRKRAIGTEDIYDPAFTNADTDFVRLAKGLRRSRTGRLLLLGPPGTGKSAIGRWLAEHLAMPLQVERASTLFSGIVSETERNIAAAFQRAQTDGALLLIDEADSFLHRRSLSSHSWEVTQVNEFLVQMENFEDGVLVLSTNSALEELDSAAMRRVDLKITFHYMRPGQSLELLRRHCSALGLGTPEEHTLARLAALTELTPGDFAMAARQSVFLEMDSASDFVSELEKECQRKSRNRARPIGFARSVD